MKALVLIMLSLSYSMADKVIGGKDALPGQFPSMALQTLRGSFFCGGTIITQYSVLSAAHCQQSGFSQYKIVAGTNTISHGGIEKDVVHIIVHGSYNSATFQNDIMIVKVATPFRFDDYRFPLAAAEIATIRPDTGHEITVAGWGDTNPGPVAQTFPNELQYVEEKVIATSVCNDVTSYNGTIYDGMICIGDMAGGIDTCQGDSGGPAYLSGTDIVAGITSWGYGCAVENFPGIYTDVAYFQDWICSYIVNDKWGQKGCQ